MKLFTTRASKRAVFEVLSPKSGDSLVAPRTSSTDYSWTILWHNTTTDLVVISLWKGYGSDLLQKDVIAGNLHHPHCNPFCSTDVAAANATNNGTYEWRARDHSESTSYALAYTDSGCDYTLQLTAGGIRVFSEYFSIQNAEDGGIPANATCISGRPANVTNTATNTASSNNVNGSGHSGMILSSGALAGIIIGTLLGTLLLCVAGLLVALRQKWIVRPSSGGNIQSNTIVSEDSYHPVAKHELPPTSIAQLPSRRDGS